MIQIKGLTLPVVSIKISLKNTTKDELIKELQEKLDSPIIKNSYFILEPDDTIPKLVLKEIEAVLNSKDIRNIKKANEQIKKQERQSRLLIIDKNLRSGQTVEHQGDILILGDVNKDALVVATGNIIVMGRLSGVAFAGALGDDKCVVVAKVMEPQQIRIGKYIAIKDESFEKPNYPEIAKVEDERIILEPVNYVGGNL